MAELLTEHLVKNVAPPPRGATTLWDSELKGFGVRVFAPTPKRPDGARSFFVNYRFDGVERRFTIGAFPTWTAKAARIEARELRKRIDKGEDPASDKRTRRDAPTVHDLALRYKEEHLPRKAAQSQRDDWRIIESEILPKLGRRKVSEIHHGDMADLHRGITARGVPVRANRVLATASKMFSLALKPAAGELAPWRDQMQGNPCNGVERNAEEGRERFFSPLELAALSEAIEAYGSTSASDCIRLVMLTGCRPGEAILATWEQFDVEPGFWNKPSAHTKQRRVHRVPLGPGPLELLDRIRRERKSAKKYASTAFVFPGQKAGQPLQQLRTAWTAIVDHAAVSLWASSKLDGVAEMAAALERDLGRRPTKAEGIERAALTKLDLPDPLAAVRIYDFRHTFASVGAGGGLSLQIIGKLLGHTQHRTTMRYAHLADDPLKEAAHRITQTISGAGQEGAQVVNLNRG